MKDVPGGKGRHQFTSLFSHREISLSATREEAVHRGDTGAGGAEVELQHNNDQEDEGDDDDDGDWWYLLLLLYQHQS